MVRKMLSVLAVAFVGLFALGGVSSAQPAVAYPPPPIVVNVTVNITIINIGGVIIFGGGGFDPFEGIDISVAYGAPTGLRNSPALMELAAAKRLTINADKTGSFSTGVTLSKVGTATITATGLSSGKVASQTVQVLGAGVPVPAGTTGSSNTFVSGGGSGSSSTLASTGASIAGPIAIGAAALFAGLALLFFGTRGVIRRRSSGHTIV